VVFLADPDRVGNPFPGGTGRRLRLVRHFNLRTGDVSESESRSMLSHSSAQWKPELTVRCPTTEFAEGGSPQGADAVVGEVAVQLFEVRIRACWPVETDLHRSH